MPRCLQCNNAKSLLALVCFFGEYNCKRAKREFRAEARASILAYACSHAVTESASADVRGSYDTSIHGG
eukprot:IDg11726t1